MTTDQMRDGFETWADAKGLTLTRIKWKDGTTSEYAYTATFDAWQVWQAAYAAGRKADQAEVERLKRDLNAAKFGRTSRKQKDKTTPAS